MKTRKILLLSEKTGRKKRNLAHRVFRDKKKILEKEEILNDETLKTLHDFRESLIKLFEFYKKENIFTSFEIRTNRNVIFSNFSINQISFQLNIVFFEKMQEISVSENARNITLTTSFGLTKKYFHNFVVKIVNKRRVGIESEKKMFSTLDNLLKNSDTFSGVRKANDKEDKQHADFFIKYRISDKKTVEIPIDCKSSYKAQQHGISKNGFGHPTINLEKLQRLIMRNARHFVIGKIKRLCDDYLSNKDITLKQIHI